MASLNVFTNDQFSMQQLTASVNLLPYTPGLLGQMGVFNEVGVNTTMVSMQFQQGKLTLIPAQARGTMTNVMSGNRRKERIFRVPHLPVNSAVMADDVQNLKAWGTESDLDTVANLVNQKMAAMKQDLEVTKEYHRLGAVHGIVLDADGSSVLYNLFTEFGVSQPTDTLDLSADDPKTKCTEWSRTIDAALGGTPYTGISAICGNDFFDGFINMPGVKQAFQFMWDGNFFMQVQANAGVGSNSGAKALQGFLWGGITWYNYRGTVGSVLFQPTNQANLFATGGTDIWMANNAPAPFMDTVNTVGQPFYAAQALMEFNLGVKLHLQCNPIFLTSRPGHLLQVTLA
jgi:hypothetical protein